MAVNTMNNKKLSRTDSKELAKNNRGKRTRKNSDYKTTATAARQAQSQAPQKAAWPTKVKVTLGILFGILVAYDQNSSIFQVVSYAWAGLGASFGPLMLCSLYWRRANKAGAVAGMLSGTAAVLIWHNLVKPLGGVFAIYELLPAFIISLLFIVVVSLLTAKPNKRMLYEFDHYMDDPLPGTLPSGTVLVDEPMEAMESEVRSGK